MLQMPNYGQLVMTGDLHGHFRNFDRLKKYANLERTPARHVVLHEMVHKELPTMQDVDRIRITRYTDAANLATNEQIVLDNLPVSPPMGVNNGGELIFDQAGMLLFSIGDVQDANNAQAGQIKRARESGSF